MFLSDEPISDASEDRLDRAGVVNGLYHAIAGWSGDSSLVIGLYGAWGEGKTSIKNLLRNRLRDGDRFLVVDFDSWFYNSSEALIQNFLSAILSRIEAHLDGPARSALKSGAAGLRRLLTSLPLSSLSFNPFGIGVSIDPSRLAAKAPTLEELKDELQAAVSKLNKRVIVLVDDLDRLGREEVRIAFKLIKLWTSFSNFIYVLPFDRQTVQEKLEEEIKADPRFLEKMVQVDVDLPVVERATLEDFMNQYLDQLSERYECSFEQDFNERFSRLWREGVQYVVTDLRTAKRYVNALAFTIPLVRGEVNYADFFGLEAVRLHFPTAYEEVGGNRQFFTSLASEFLGQPELTERERAAFFDGLLERGGGDNSRRRDTLSAILSGIFPLFENHVRKTNISYSGMSQEWSREQRATSERCFDRYFVMALRRGQVSDAWVQALVRGLNAATPREAEKALQAAIHEMKKEEKLKAFLDSLVLFESSIDVARVDAVAHAVARTSHLFGYISAPFVDTEVDAAIRLVFLMAARIEKDEAVGRMLNRVVKDSRLAFGATLVAFCEPAHNRIVSDFTHVSQGRLRETLQERFKEEYVDSTRNIFDDDPVLGFRVLYQLSDKEMVTEYMTGLAGRDADVVERLADNYVRDWPELGRTEVRMADLDKLLDVERLHEALQDVELPESASDKAKWLFDVMSGDEYRELLTASRQPETPSASEGEGRRTPY